MKHRLSALTLFAMMGVMLWCTTIFYPRYKQPANNATLAWDAAGYYWYLPSVFIYHDLAEQRWADSIITKYQPGPADVSGFGFRADNGHMVMKYPAGMALAEAPFFFMAHVLAKPLGYPADGFSQPYQTAIQLGALLVAFIGLWLLRRLLLFYYTDGVTALCLFVLVIGTNYLNYSAIDGSIAHNWLFTLYVGLILCTRSFYLKPSAGGALTIGALCGLSTLIRPTDVIACIIPVLWGLENIRVATIRQRFAFFRKHVWKLLSAVLIAGCIIAVQLVYWKVVSGHWLVYSYQDQGFSWLHPHVRAYTFSYRSGWITYTPAMILALIGFIPFVLRRSPNRVVLTAFVAAAFYLVTAWDVWWYAGMGGRAMVQYYPALLFPMASLFTWVAERRLRSIVAAPVVLLLVYINVWFTYHAHGGGLYDADGGMTQEYYQRVIGRWSAPEAVQKLKDGKYLYEAPLPATARVVYTNALDTPDRKGAHLMLTLDSARQSSPYYVFAFHRQPGEQWLRAEATFQCLTKEWYVWQMTQFILRIRRRDQVVRESMIRVQRFVEKGEAKRLCVDQKLPEVQAGDSVSVHFWNADSKERIIIKDLRVLAF